MLAAVDELDEKTNISDQTWAALGERLDEHQRMDLVFTIGGYIALAMALNTFGVEVEADQTTGTERGRTLPHFPKPAAGSWTENYPELGTAPVDYTDSIDPAFFEAERDAIFKRTWLNVGRVERLPRTGSYFTKELPSAGPGMSVIIVKTKDGSIKAYHNVCRHRGNKLVWNDFPHEETSGTCRQFTCKYHAWRYSLDGDLTFIQQEDEFFDVDKSQYGLVAGPLRGVGRLHLHQLRPATPSRSPTTSGRWPRASRATRSAR